MKYESFRALAKNNNLSRYEKIGFLDSQRKDKEIFIFDEITNKLTNLNLMKKKVLDIGPGCSDIPKLLIDLCDNQEHTLVFCDCEEMLAYHENKEFLFKIPGMFPNTFDQIHAISPKYDVILCYSVFQSVFVDINSWNFIDKCMMLLNPRGQFLIGDIPNSSKRKRFFSSQAGIEYHKKFMKVDNNPEVIFNKIEAGNIDDSVILSLIMRVRAAGFDAYLMPQGENLPLSNRREDILIIRP